MKHFFFLLLATPLISPTLSGQNDALQNFIDQHKGDQGFTYAFLSKDLFEVATQSNVKDEDWKGLHNVVKNIGSLRILASEKIENGLPLYKEVKALVPNDVFDELLTVRDGNENVRIWAKSEENLVTDLILLVGSPDDFVLVCFAGNLELGNVADLAKLFEAGKAEQLARTSVAVAIDFGISPNPSNGQFSLSYSDEKDPPALLSIMDQSGRPVSTISLSGAATQQVFLRDLPTGTYWIQLKTQNGKVGVKQVQIVKG
ncbi:MAG: DUF4252 domain-containing protein [Phycisphaerae bacterium]|nr:DUF4252 domain-containing protein [Saprospiraceae bacterium]